MRQLITLLGVLFIASAGQAEETISHRSPDKKFAVRLTDDKAELIALPSRKKVLEFDPLPASGIVAVTWTPDSRRFAAGEDEESAEHGRPGDFRTVEVFERTGTTFRKVGLPDLRYPEADWPKGMSRKSPRVSGATNNVITHDQSARAHDVRFTLLPKSRLAR